MSVHTVTSVALRRAEPLVGSNTPARLLRLGLVLVVGCLVTAVVSLVSGLDRQQALEAANGRVSALNETAAQLYGALADADAMATSGYVSGGAEPAATRQRYEQDLTNAAGGLVAAATELPDDDPARPLVLEVSQRLPDYAGLVATARVYNRQGLPLGQSYLGEATQLMRQTLLPSVDRVRELQTATLAEDYRAGGAIPYPVLLLGAAALLGLLDAARRERRRTNRVINPGLAAAAGLMVLVLLWWGTETVVTAVNLAAASRHSTARTALADAHTAVLQARSNEALVLVARSGVSASDAGFTSRLELVLGPSGTEGLLAAAEVGGPGAHGGSQLVAEVRRQAQQWRQAHQRLRQLDDGGRYADAVASATGADATGSGAAFARLDAAFDQAAAAQRGALWARAGAARAALTGLAGGPATLAALAAVAAALGVAVRIMEYR